MIDRLRSMSLTQKGLLFAALFLVFQFILFAQLSWLQSEVLKNERYIDRSLQHGKAISRLMMDSLKVTTDAFHERVGAESFDKIRADRDQLVLLRGDLSPKKQLLIDAIVISLENIEGLTKRVTVHKKRKDYGRYEQALREELRASVTKAVDSCRELTKFVNEERAKALEGIKMQQADRQQTELVLQAGMVIEALLACAGLWWFKADIEQRIGVVYENTKRLAQRKPLLPELTGNDDITQLDTVFHNMSDALEKARSNRHAMVEYSRDVICQLDHQLVTISINAASYTLLGHLSENMLGKKITDLVDPADVEEVIEMLRQVSEGQSRPHAEVRMKSADGTIIDTLWSARWSPTDRSFFCVIHDNRQKKRAERLRQDVLQMVNHDLRTPLFTVSSFLEMGHAGVFGELSNEGNKELARSLSGTTQMLVLVEDLLDLEKINAGMLQLGREEVTAYEVLDDAIMTASEWLSDRKIEMSGSDREINLIADATRIKQVLVKLITALADFTAPGSTITLSASTAQDSLELIVSGERSPISESLIQELFDPYNEQSQPLMRHERNSRMSLAVCKALVTLQGGTLTFSNANESCRFAVQIPNAVTPKAVEPVRS